MTLYIFTALHAAIFLFTCIHSQYLSGTPKYYHKYEIETEQLERLVKSHPHIIDTHFPDWWIIDQDVYRFEEDHGDYEMNVIFQPCLGHASDCCMGVYGEPEYYKPDDISEFSATKDLLCDTASDKYDWSSFACLENMDGSSKNNDSSRAAYEDMYIEPACMGVKEPYDNCIGRIMARRRAAVFPVCWDHNDTIAADTSCQAVNGTYIDSCIALAYTQNAFVVQCGGAYEMDSHCGTFLEIHHSAIGFYPNNLSILAEVKLYAGYPSGYESTVIDLHFQGDPGKLLCQGPYELWWVQRTRYDFIVEKKIPFGIISPSCDWDPITGIYFPYHTTTTTTTTTTTAADTTIDLSLVYPEKYHDLLADIGVGGVWYSGDLNNQEDPMKYLYEDVATTKTG